MARITPERIETDLRDIVLQAMSSTNEYRREAAMTTFYQSHMLLGEDELARIQSASEWDLSPVVRDIARAVLAKRKAMTTP